MKISRFGALLVYAAFVLLGGCATAPTQGTSAAPPAPSQSMASERGPETPTSEPGNHH
jgi:uncharacterized lipoprotein YajG